MKFIFSNRQDGNVDHQKPLVKALKRAGYKVDEIVKRKKKTVITVSTAEIKNEAEAAPDV